jgi:predicted nuclease of predicted toxin-antitoxin system
MKIKLEQNISHHLRKFLEELDHEVDTVFDEGLSGAPDLDVISAASSADRLLFTLDTDFLDFKRYPPASRTGVVVFRPPRQGALTIIEVIKAFVESADLRRHRRRTTIVERTRVRIFK